jgi:hypothetical protein
MNDLKESNETSKQTTDELKNLIDLFNQEKNDWAKKSDIENLDEKIRNLQNLIVRNPFFFQNIYKYIYFTKF